MDAGKLEKVIVPLTAGLVALAQTSDFDPLKLCVVIACIICFFSSLGLVLLGHRIPAFVAKNIDRACGFTLVAVLALFWCVLTADRAGREE